MLLADGVRGYVVLDHPTILAISRDPQTWSRDSRRWGAWPKGAIAPDSELAELAAMMAWRDNLLFADGSAHTRLRTAVVEALGHVDERALAALVRAEADQLINAFAPQGHADLVTQYATLLPLRIIMRLVGLDPEEVNHLLPVLQRIWDGDDAAAANVAYEHTLRTLICRQRAWPSRNITTFLDNHAAELTDDELLQHLVLIVGAASAPTGNLISNTLGQLLTRGPIARDFANRRIDIPEAIQQVLWEGGPMLVYPFVYPTADVRLGRHLIPAGTPVGMAITSANLAVAMEMGGVMHGNRAHASFGTGPHKCPGQAMALLIATHAIQALFKRLPHPQLADPQKPLSYRPSVFAYALSSLRVVFRPILPEGLPWQTAPAWFSPPATSTVNPTVSVPAGRSPWWSFLGRLRRSQ
ncbi:cytochrome P450 [Streptosporangium lutulentum]|uniref:Cytochrome P450 n=1 Tax=Streptosporangium lutulentum TaxID=1461250 RepID=A0ABT9QWG0_9ACTN|nr:cytochrome P450 [Streptosporangium lutulentum]MDP9850384.1 cytochrome P450 [Streptosporangium lutulentum]